MRLPSCFFDACPIDGLPHDAPDCIEMFLSDLRAEALLKASAKRFRLASQCAGGAGIDRAARGLQGLAADFGGILLDLFEVRDVARGDQSEGGERDQNSHAR